MTPSCNAGLAQPAARAMRVTIQGSMHRMETDRKTAPVRMAAWGPSVLSPLRSQGRRLPARERLDDMLHDRRADTVSEKTDTIPSRTNRHQEIVPESHRPTQLGNLKHAEHGSFPFPCHKPEPVERRKGTP
jgi:hypothetical protein